MPKNVATNADTAAKPSARKSAVRNTSAKKEIVPDENAAIISEESAAEIKKVFKVKESLGLHDYVTVRNGFNGKLVYKSKRTGERLVWDDFGSEQEMELQELKNAKNSSRAFFENNWFMIDDPEVIAFLGVERCYKNSLSYDEFDTLFEMSSDKIKERVSMLPSGQKTSLIYRAKQKIEEGEIDSLRVINALEESLGVELIER